jgi:Fuc2NAc and GlcNAc transferase
MMVKTFIICSLLSFFLSLFLSVLTLLFGLKLGLVDTPNERSSHKAIIPRSGGIGIWVAFILTGLFFTQFQVFTILAGIVGLIGLLEDRFSISQKIRLVLKLIISALVVSSFLGIPTSIISISLFVFWIIFIAGTANFYNFMDGVDGIAGLTGVVGCGFLAFFSIYIVEKPDVALFSTVISVGCIGFLFFNFPKAKVFMGDVGSIFLGFVFAAFVIKLSTNLSIFLCLIMFMCMFYADALVTILCRWKRGENLIMAHRSHLYQYICNELKIPHWKVSLSYASTQFVFAVLALSAYKKGIVWQIVVFVFFVVMFLIIDRIIKNIKPTTYICDV